MSENHIGELLLLLAALFGLTYAIGGLLEKLRIPGILGALFVAMAVHYTPFGADLLRPPLYEAFSFLAQLGVLFLLFFIGLQIDLKEMKALSGDIIRATVLNTTIPFLFGGTIMLTLGYGWTVAFVIGLTMMPTAEAVIVPILDEFQMVRTRVGEFIIGAGVLDDVIEVFLIAFVSIWIGEQTIGVAGSERETLMVAVGIGVFTIMALICYRWILPLIGGWLPQRPRNLILLTILVLFSFGGLAEYSSLGIIVGAIVAGVLLRPVFNRAGASGERATGAVRAFSYGFLGIVFFFWVGLSVDLQGMFAQPELAVLLFMAAFLGKLVGIFLMVPLRKLTVPEAWAVGIGLNARLTTEIIVAKLLLDAKLIDVELFTALVAAASLSTLIVPLVFTVLVRKWGRQLSRPMGKLIVRKVGRETV